MNCAGCDNCVFTDAMTDVEWQEIHVTALVENEAQRHVFHGLTTSHGGKLVEIVLPTDHGSERQIMTSIPFKGSRSSAIEIGRTLARQLTAEGICVERIKLECSLTANGDYSNGYFEGHFAISADVVSDEVRSAVKAMGARVSTNAFKQGTFMVTKRCGGDIHQFMSEMDDIQNVALADQMITKRIHEFCYRDSNFDLDRNWT